MRCLFGRPYFGRPAAVSTDQLPMSSIRAEHSSGLTLIDCVAPILDYFEVVMLFAQLCVLLYWLFSMHSTFSISSAIERLVRVTISTFARITWALLNQTNFEGVTNPYYNSVIKFMTKRMNHASCMKRTKTGARKHAWRTESLYQKI